MLGIVPVLLLPNVLKSSPKLLLISLGKSGLFIPLYLKVENLPTYREAPFLTFFQVKYAYRFGYLIPK